MPNHCWNTTEVFGPDEDVQFFHERVANDLANLTEVEICDSLLPLSPSAIKTVKGMTSTVFASNGYELAVELWGTKWGDYDTEGNPGKYTYTTAWGPMERAWATISLMFPSLTFLTTWHEEDFHYGAFVAHKGKLTERGGERYESPRKAIDPDDEQAWNEAYEKDREAIQDELAHFRAGFIPSLT